MIIYIILIIIILLYIYNYTHKKELYNMKECNIDKIYDNIKTGDIILFRRDKLDIFSSMISLFTHVGIIVVFNNKKYILETHNKNDTKYMGYETIGVNLYDIKERIMNYKGNCYIVPINNISSLQQNLLINNIAKYKNIKFDNNFKQHIMTYCILKKICNTCINKTTKKNMFCSEFITFILIDLGIISNNIEKSCITPNNILNLTDINNKLLFKSIIKII